VGTSPWRKSIVYLVVDDAVWQETKNRAAQAMP